MKKNNHLKANNQFIQHEDKQADPQSNPTTKALDTLLVLHTSSEIIGIVQDINTDGTLQ